MSGFSTMYFASALHNGQKGGPISKPYQSPAHHNDLRIGDFPTEIIRQIFSYLPISFCTHLLQSIPLDHDMSKLLYRSVYERNVFFGHPFLDWKWLSKRGSLKQIGCSELELLVRAEARRDLSIPPKTFIFDYVHDNNFPIHQRLKWLRTFNHCVKRSQRYFSLTQNMELSIDVSDKTSDLEDGDLELDTMASVLARPEWHCKLTKLHLRGFRDNVWTGQSVEALLVENLVHFTNLKELHILGISIKRFDKLILPRRLSSLWFAGNGVEVLPTNNGEFFPPNLESLFLASNRISSIANVVFPPHLKRLDMDYNSLKTLGGVMWPLDLRVLTLRGNQIELGEEKVQLPEHLQVLQLQNNPIRSFEGLSLPNSLRRISIDERYSNFPINVPRRDSIIYA